MAGIKNLTPFKPGQSGNPNGRPRKLLGELNEELKAQGITPVSKAQLEEAYRLVFNLSEADAKRLKDDHAAPFWLRKVIAYIGSATGKEMIREMQDRVYGRPNQTITATITEVPDPDAESAEEAMMLKQSEENLRSQRRMQVLQSFEDIDKEKAKE